jgi:hypothetical protein
MENQAFKFIIVHAKDEWCRKNHQQECQENYLENDNHL